MNEEEESLTPEQVRLEVQRLMGMILEALQSMKEELLKDLRKQRVRSDEDIRAIQQRVQWLTGKASCEVTLEGPPSA